MMKKPLLFCVVIFLLAQPLFAHDMWLQESGEGFDILVGHQGRTEPYESERVKEVVGYSEDGQPAQLAVVREKGGCMFVPGEPFCAIGAFLDNKYWMHTTEGWKNQRQRQGLEILKEGHSYKCTKHIVKWCDAIARPLGQRFEVVPLQDPTRLKAGDRLPVKIFFEGKIASAARVASTSNMEKTHDLESVQGEDPFMVDIGPAGLQLINAKLEMPVKDQQVVWYAASLTFYTKK